MDRWKGRVAIVTGTSSGIGLTIAEKLAENGLKVIGLARREDRLKQLESKINNKKRGTFFGLRTDISNKDELLAAFEWAKKNVGPISLVVNNAAQNHGTSIIDCEFDTWQAVIDISLKASIVCCGLGLQQMKENDINDGHIVNINSVAGHSILNVKGVSVYTASKHGLRAFTESLRKELALQKSQIRITSISPGFVETEMAGRPELKVQLRQRPALDVEDVANCLIFAISSPPHVQISEMIVQPTGEEF